MNLIAKTANDGKILFIKKALFSYILITSEISIFDIPTGFNPFESSLNLRIETK
jgi:hypothetical protein